MRASLLEITVFADFSYLRKHAALQGGYQGMTGRFDVRDARTLRGMHLRGPRECVVTSEPDPATVVAWLTVGLQFVFLG